MVPFLPPHDHVHKNSTHVNMSIFFAHQQRKRKKSRTEATRAPRRPSRRTRPTVPCAARGVRKVCAWSHAWAATLSHALADGASHAGMLKPMQPTRGWGAKIDAAPRLRTIAGAPGHGAKRVDGPHRAAELAMPPSTSEALQQQDLPERSRKSPPAGEYLVSKSEARGMGFEDGRSRLLGRTGTACRLDAFRAARLADRATEHGRRREFFDGCPCHLRTAHFLTEQVSMGRWPDMWAVYPCRCRCRPSSTARTAGASEQSAIADEMVAK